MWQLQWDKNCSLVYLSLFLKFVYLPDGSSSKSGCPGWEMSFMMLFAFSGEPGTVQLLQCGERAPGDLLCSFNDSLKCCPLDHCAAAVPHTYTICEDAHILRCGFSSEPSRSAVSDGPFLAAPRCSRPRSGPPQDGLPGSGSPLPFPH